MVEDPKANVSLPYRSIVYKLASMLDILVLKFCGPPLVDAKLNSCLWKSLRIFKAFLSPS